jgi:LysM repeat protein
MSKLRNFVVGGLVTLVLAGAAAGRTHTIKKGDTYWRLGGIYNVPVSAIAAANPKVNPNNMPIGYELVIPESEKKNECEKKSEESRPVRLILQRDTFTDKSTIGVLYEDKNYNGVVDTKDIKLGYTLELPFNNNHNNISSIPIGEYRLTQRTSERFRSHYLVNDVPGRSYILIHAGNYPKDTSGCILLGKTKGKDFVGNSRAALGDLLQRFRGKDLYLKVTNNSQ